MQGKDPKYQQVADAVARQIHDGTHAVGSLLPTETELAARFDVSRHTIRHGLRELRARGLIVSRQGRGSKVKAVYPAEMGSNAVHSFSDFLASPCNWQLKVEATKVIVAGENLSSILECAPHARLVEVRGEFICPDLDTRHDPAPAVLYADELFSGFFSGLASVNRYVPLMLANAYGMRIKRIVQEVGMEPVEGAQTASGRQDRRQPALLFDGRESFSVRSRILPAERLCHRLAQRTRRRLTGG